MEVEIHLLKSNDIEKLKALISVFEVVFEMENFNQPDEVHLQRLLKNETFFAVVAESHNRIIAGLTVYVLHQYYSLSPLAYIYDLAVLKEYQRQGVGKKLIDFTNKYCSSKGFEASFVQAEKVDEYAIDFYRLTNPAKEEQVVHFTYVFTNDNENNSR